MVNKTQSYPEYKNVAYDYANELPKDWELLPNIAIFQERIERGFGEEELLSVTIGKGVIKQTEVDIKKDSSNEDKSKYKLIKIGDIAYNKMRMWQGALGYSDYQGISSPAYIILKPKIKIDPKFFHYMFRTGFYTNYSKRFSYGIVDDQLSLRYTDFKRMYSIVPPLSTQNAIVEYLDKKNTEIDKFIQNKERLIELLEERKIQNIEKLVTKGINKNVKTKSTNSNLLGEVPEHWKVKKIRYCSKLVKTGTTPSGTARDYFENGTFNWFTPGDFNTDLKLESSQKKVVLRAIKDKEVVVFPKNSILIIGIGGTLGKVGIISEEGSSNQQVNAVVFKKEVLPYYGLYILWLLGKNLIKTLSYSALPILNQNQTKELLISIPPKEEQILILSAIKTETDKIDIATSKAKAEIFAIKEYRESLITDLVLGKRSVNNLSLN